MLLKIVALFLCIAYATCAEYVQSSDCANTTVYSQNIRMEVSGCHSDDTHCPLYRGQNHTVVFTFDVMRPFMDKTDARLYGVFERFTVPYGKKSDACEIAHATDDGTTCRSHGGFLADREYKHVTIFPVSPNYPMIKLKVRFVFYDRRTKMNLLCREVAVDIKDPTTEENEA